MLSKYGGSMLSQVKLASNRMRPRLAIIAHDGKKADLVAFATFNRSRLQEYDIVATGATGDLLRDKVGLEVERVTAGPHGGDVQIHGGPAGQASARSRYPDAASNLQRLQHSAGHEHRHRGCTDQFAAAPGISSRRRELTPHPALPRKRGRERKRQPFQGSVDRSCCGVTEQSGVVRHSPVPHERRSRPAHAWHSRWA